MPVVTAIVYRNTKFDLDDLKRRLEEAYITAWTSLGTEFRAEDICSLVCKNPDHATLNLLASVTVIFYYRDRGQAFRSWLYRALDRAVSQILGVEDRVDVITVPVDPNHWSADPAWSQAPCRRPHLEGMPMSGYGYGYGWI